MRTYNNRGQLFVIQKEKIVRLFDNYTQGQINVLMAVGVIPTFKQLQ